MTPTSYFVALLAKSFGISRRNKRMADASSEMGLLREAEHQLGVYIWERAEEVDELSVEYWNLRKLVKEHDALATRLNELNEKVADAHFQRAEILKRITPEQVALENERAEFLRVLENMAYERDNIIRRAKEIRRIHDGMLTKVEVLQRDDTKKDQIPEVQAMIENIKQEFRELKARRQQMAIDLEEGDRKLDQIDHELDRMRQARRDEASVIFATISEVNRELSQLRADIGVLATQIHQLQSEIGRYVSRYAKRNPACAQIIREQRTLVEVMRMLRMSIAMNHKLADFK